MAESEIQQSNNEVSSPRDREQEVSDYIEKLDLLSYEKYERISVADRDQIIGFLNKLISENFTANWNGIINIVSQGDDGNVISGNVNVNSYGTLKHNADGEMSFAGKASANFGFFNIDLEPKASLTLDPSDEDALLFSVISGMPGEQIDGIESSSIKKEDIRDLSFNFLSDKDVDIRLIEENDGTLELVALFIAEELIANVRNSANDEISKDLTLDENLSNDIKYLEKIGNIEKFVIPVKLLWSTDSRSITEIGIDLTHFLKFLVWGGKQAANDQTFDRSKSAIFKTSDFSDSYSFNHISFNISSLEISKDKLEITPLK